MTSPAPGEPARCETCGESSTDPERYQRDEPDCINPFHRPTPPPAATREDDVEAVARIIDEETVRLVGDEGGSEYLRAARAVLAHLASRPSSTRGETAGARVLADIISEASEADLRYALGDYHYERAAREAKAVIDAALARTPVPPQGAYRGQDVLNMVGAVIDYFGQTFIVTSPGKSQELGLPDTLATGHVTPSAITFLRWATDVERATHRLPPHGAKASAQRETDTAQRCQDAEPVAWQIVDRTDGPTGYFGVTEDAAWDDMVKVTGCSRQWWSAERYARRLYTAPPAASTGSGVEKAKAAFYRAARDAAQVKRSMRAYIKSRGRAPDHLTPEAARCEDRVDFTYDALLAAERAASSAAACEKKKE